MQSIPQVTDAQTGDKLKEKPKSFLLCAIRTASMHIEVASKSLWTLLEGWRIILLKKISSFGVLMMMMMMMIVVVVVDGTV